MSPSHRLPLLRGCSIRQRAFRRACRMGPKRGIVTKERRAIGTDDLACIAHVEEHVWLTKRSQLARAHGLPRADLADRDARRVVEVMNNPLRHVLRPPSTRPSLRLPRPRGTIASRVGHG